MLATVPQTVPGCMALLDHMIDDVGVDVEEALSVLREALDGHVARATSRLLNLSAEGLPLVWKGRF